jgi:hypothetical protein
VDTARFDGSRREEVLTWSVDEADDGEDPPVPYFIATEARFDAHNYEPLGVILSRGGRVWVWDAVGKRCHCHPKS